MTNQRAPRAREEGRHWLPSQGVDPAPLAELNAECLGLLASRAAEGATRRAVPPLVLVLREQWADLPSVAVRRLAAAPFSLFDIGFARAPRWLETRARGVNDQTQRAENPYLRSGSGAFHHAPHAGLRLASRRAAGRERLAWCSARVFPRSNRSPRVRCRRSRPPRSATPTS